MKRKAIIIILALALCLIFTLPALAADSASQPQPTPVPASSSSLTAKPTASAVLVDGQQVAFDAYNIEGNNYFKLRDLANVLNGSAKQFEVGWDGANNAISLTSGQAYTPVGGEMQAGAAGEQTPSLTTAKILLDGVETALTAYNIGGNNYFKLRDVGQTFDFAVEWNSVTSTIVIDTSKGYAAAPESDSGSALTLSNSDYSAMSNWLSFGGDKSKDVDVFVIYPSVTVSMDTADRPYVRLDSTVMLEAATGWLMGNQGLVAESANIYAPLYRQLNAVELDSLNSDTFASYTNATPRDDIFAAFDYYLTNVNKGERPFILLGQSQGAQLVIELATTFLGNEKYAANNKNLIAAYAIGCSVVESQIALNPQLKFSQSKDDTGVIVSWNTTSPNEIATGAYTQFGTWKSGALITNPITWLTGETPAQATDNKASKVMRPDGAFEMVEAFANAIVDNEHNVLVTTTMDEENYQSMSVKISKYHQHDIAFYYESIKQNIKDRIAAFGR